MLCWCLCHYTADLQDDEASQQVQSTQLAAAEIERLAEDKQRLAEHLQQEVRTLPHLFTLLAFVLFQESLESDGSSVPVLNSCFCSIEATRSNLLISLDGMVVYRRLPPSLQHFVAGTH